LSHRDPEVTEKIKREKKRQREKKEKEKEKENSVPSVPPW
jgi:hypothetical protein